MPLNTSPHALMLVCMSPTVWCYVYASMLEAISELSHDIYGSDIPSPSRDCLLSSMMKSRNSFQNYLPDSHIALDKGWPFIATEIDGKLSASSLKSLGYNPSLSQLLKDLAIPHYHPSCYLHLVYIHFFSLLTRNTQWKRLPPDKSCL